MTTCALETAIRNIYILHDHEEDNNSIHVAIRMIFLRIGEIDTRTETFQAHVAIEARWFINCEEEIKYTMNKRYSQIQIREFRDICEELSISIGSALFDSEVTLEADSNRPSGINHEAFVNQQEWKLYDHIETRTKFIKGFLFQNDEDYILYTPGHEQKRSILTIACHAARRADYFFWNGYCLILLITIISFSSFAIPPKYRIIIVGYCLAIFCMCSGVQFRIAISCTFLLTSIAFRWTISNALPNISYLTVIDLCAIVSIFVLIVLCIWHSIIGAIVFIHNEHSNLRVDSYWVWLDRIIFLLLVSLYVVVHIVMGCWCYFVPISRKKNK